MSLISLFLRIAHFKVADKKAKMFSNNVQSSRVGMWSNDSFCIKIFQLRISIICVLNLLTKKQSKCRYKLINKNS